MDRVKTSFSIKNLEHLSGIKAHTIRIWEKRYNLLSQSAQKRTSACTISIAYKNFSTFRCYTKMGLRFQKLPKWKLPKSKKRSTPSPLQKSPYDWSLGLFKLSMINFDQRMFTNTFDELMEKMSFGEIYQSIFTPLMIELGVLWQTNSISPSHEHFITSLIKQKIHSLCEKLQENQPLNTNPKLLSFTCLTMRYTNWDCSISITKFLTVVTKPSF